MIWAARESSYASQDWAGFGSGTASMALTQFNTMPEDTLCIAGSPVPPRRSPTTTLLPRTIQKKAVEKSSYPRIGTLRQKSLRFNNLAILRRIGTLSDRA